MSRPARTVLAIEAAVSGGSIAIISDGEQIAAWTGSTGQSRAEALMPNVKELLVESASSVCDIDLIAVSAGPGSFTGIRIGIATALGLKMGLGIQMASESVLKCIAAAYIDGGSVTVAIPMGRGAICQQRFEFQGQEVIALGEPATLPEADFVESIAQQDSLFVVHSEIFEQIDARENVINSGRNLAVFVGRFCIANPQAACEPLFISKTF